MTRRKGFDQVKSVGVLQHTACETLGTMEDVLRGNGTNFEYIETHRGALVPGEIADKSGLIVMGGPMGVYEYAKYPFLRDEMRLIESDLSRSKLIGAHWCRERSLINRASSSWAAQWGSTNTQSIHFCAMKCA